MFFEIDDWVPKIEAITKMIGNLESSLEMTLND